MPRRKRRDSYSRERLLRGKRWYRRGKRLVRLEDINEAEHTKKPSTTIQKPANVQTISILDLPDECIVLILEKLNLKPHEMGEIMKVCKKFYHATLNPRLWRIADFRFGTYLFDNHTLEITQDMPRYLSEFQRRKMFANFLIKRKAMLSHLRIAFDIHQEMNTFRTLLHKCSLRYLKNVDIRWTVYWQYLSSDEKELQSEYFKKVLEKLSTSSPDISSLKCQLDGSSLDMVEILVKLKNIQALHLIFVGRMSRTVIEEGVLEFMLSSLPKLKELKIKVTQTLNESFRGYSLKSNTLEDIEFSCSKGLRIRELHLPNLRTFMADNVFEFFQGRNCPCLFELIRNGCPKLTSINYEHSNVAGLDNFDLDVEDEREMHICQCDIHAPWRVQH